MVNSFNYKWLLKDGFPASGIKANNLKVFGTFVCGGGSTMGYKLAGFNHLGGVEIDKRIAEVYNINHKPKYFYNQDIRDFLLRDNLPKELFDLDILDGSPPCSVFSMAGKREAGWQVEKKFKEGQKKQRLDDLFFIFIEVAKKLKPKVIIAENVRGLIQGKAKIYLKDIVLGFKEAGYIVQVFLLNSSCMGVPQARERVFFIARRKDLNFPKLNLFFEQRKISFNEISDNAYKEQRLTPKELEYWNKAKQGETVGKFDTKRKAYYNKPLPTIASSCNLYHPILKRTLNKTELILGSSFPLDFNFNKTNYNFILGMSVPPLMTANIANEIYKQWFFNG
jgi:DNA (cytosine-5)-methyltransferase 1